MVKNRLITFKVTDEEKEYIKKRADSIGESVSTYIRLVVLNKKDTLEDCTTSVQKLLARKG